MTPPWDGLSTPWAICGPKPKLGGQPKIDPDGNQWVNPVLHQVEEELIKKKIKKKI